MQYLLNVVQSTHYNSSPKTTIYTAQAMSAHDSAKSTPHDMPQKWLHYGLMITGACQVASLSVWHRQVALVSTPRSQPENPELKQTLKGFPKAIKLSKVYRLKSTLQ